MSDDFVSHQKFYETILDINKQRAAEIDSIKRLIIETADNAEKGNLLRHTNLRGAIRDQSIESNRQIREVLDELKHHKEDDDEVEKRVTIIEESQKRMVWIIGLALPGMLAAWEGLKVKLNLK